MNRKLMSMLLLGILVAALAATAMGIGSLIEMAAQGSFDALPALLQMSVGIALWMLGVRLVRAANAIASGVRAACVESR
jgi:hypothetical protein